MSVNVAEFSFNVKNNDTLNEDESSRSSDNKSRLDDLELSGFGPFGSIVRDYPDKDPRFRVEDAVRILELYSENSNCTLCHKPIEKNPKAQPHNVKRHYKRYHREEYDAYCKGIASSNPPRTMWRTTSRATQRASQEINSSGSSDYLYSSDVGCFNGAQKRPRHHPSIESNHPYLNIPIRDTTDQPTTSSSIDKLEPHSAKSNPVSVNEQLLSAIEAVIENGNNKVHDEASEGALFGRIIGRRLDRLDPKKRARILIDIQSLLYKYEFEE